LDRDQVLAKLVVHLARQATALRLLQFDRLTSQPAVVGKRIGEL
jgi:hypothetical protein